jgi:hypothetical protein
MGWEGTFIQEDDMLVRSFFRSAAYLLFSAKPVKTTAQQHPGQKRN